MQNDMSDKIALVTGGSRGLGKSTALHLAEKGVGVVLTYMSRSEDADAVVAQIEALGGRAAALQLDTGDTSQFEAFVHRFNEALMRVWERSTFDYLVNNAGIGIHSAIAETTEESFDSLVNIHFKGVFFLTQRLLPIMEDGGRIVNISTGLTRFTYPGYAAYAAAKGAVEVLTRYLAKELGDRGISVNTLAPGATETDFGGGGIRDNAELNQYLASTTAMGRVGKPEDIGGAITSMLTGDNKWITGQRVEASGGQHL